MKQHDEKQILARFGGHVAQLRAERSITQEQLAEKTGLDRMTIAFVENGRRWPRIATLDRLAQGLGVRISDLFKGM